MKVYNILAVLFVSVLSAQTHRFIYEYAYIPNINKKEVVKKDMMALDINAEGSKYESIASMRRDSLVRAQAQAIFGGRGNSINMNNSIGQAARDAVRYKVLKETASQKIYLVEQVQMNKYKILEEEKPNWKIYPETTKIGEYKAQKATTTWGGRNWTAWFATDLPFNDGPYKFNGLPGLIVKIEDDTQSHIMTLVANTLLENSSEQTQETTRREGNTTIITRGFDKEIPVSETQFKKVWKDYLADPSSDIRQRMGMRTSPDGNRREVTFMRTPDGREINEKEMKKMAEERAKREVEENNNRIEPTLYQ